MLILLPFVQLTVEVGKNNASLRPPKLQLRKAAAKPGIKDLNKYATDPSRKLRLCCLLRRNLQTALGYIRRF
jgi:hypothetical protein